MKKELDSAVEFVSDLLSKKVPVNKATVFRQTLLRLLVNHCQDHWFPEKPFRGSAYRCIRINHKMDPLLSRAGRACGFTETQLFNLLPNEFTMWIDPREVTYRIGEEGSIGLIYEKEAETETQEVPPVPASTPSPPPHPPSNQLVNQASQQRQQQQQQQQQQQLLHHHQQQSSSSGHSSYNAHNNNSPMRRQGSPVQLQQLHHVQQSQHHHHHQQQQQQLQSSMDFFRTCKDQLRYILPESSEAMNFEYLSTFVAS